MARVLVLFAAPVVFLAGILAHPFVETYLETHVVAGAIEGAPGQWLTAHVTMAVGIGLVLLVVLVIAGHLRDAGERRWSAIGTPMLVVGGALMAALVGAEITLGAVAHTGGDVHTVLATGITWPLALAGMPLFAAGWLCFAMAFYRSSLLPRALNRVAIVALVTSAIALLAIPQTSGTYIYGFGVLVVSWLVGYRVVTTASSSTSHQRAPQLDATHS